MPWLNGCAPLTRGVEETLLQLTLLGAGVFAAALGSSHVLLLLGLESHLRQRLDHLKSEETQDVDDVVRGLAVGDDAEARPLAKALALAPGKRCLAVLGPSDIFLPGHGLGALVSLAQSLKGDVIHLFLFLVVLVVSLGDLDGVKGGRLPWQADLGLFVLLSLDVDGTASGNYASRVVSTSEVGISTFVVRVLDIFTHVFPRQKSTQSGYFGLIMADLENEIVCADRFGAAPGCKLSAVSELR